MATGDLVLAGDARAVWYRCHLGPERPLHVFWEVHINAALNSLRQEWSIFPNEVDGQRVISVSYMHSDPGWPHGHVLDASLHEVDFAVLLGLSGGKTAAVVWEMVSEVETISTVVAPLVDICKSPRMQAIATSVSDISPWPDLLGLQIRSVAMVFARDGAEPEGVDFVIETTRVRVRLGEVDGGKLRRIPDAVVVEFGGLGRSCPV